MASFALIRQMSGLITSQSLMVKLLVKAKNKVFSITNMYIYTKIESLGQSDRTYADFKIISCVYSSLKNSKNSFKIRFFSC